MPYSRKYSFKKCIIRKTQNKIPEKYKTVLYKGYKKAQNFAQKFFSEPLKFFFRLPKYVLQGKKKCNIP